MQNEEIALEVFPETSSNNEQNETQTNNSSIDNIPLNVLHENPTVAPKSLMIMSCLSLFLVTATIALGITWKIKKETDNESLLLKIWAASIVLTILSCFVKIMLKDKEEAVGNTLDAGELTTEGIDMFT